MASKKTILLIEATSKQWHIKYSGKFGSDWSDLSKSERREVLRHDGRIVDALLSMPDEIYQRLAFLFRTAERIKRREARRAAQNPEPQTPDKVV